MHTYFSIVTSKTILKLVPLDSCFPEALIVAIRSVCSRARGQRKPNDSARDNENTKNRCVINRAIGSRAIRARATACCPPRVRFRKLILSIPLHRSSAVDRLIMQRGIAAISSEERIPDSVVPFSLPRSLVPPPRRSREKDRRFINEAFRNKAGRRVLLCNSEGIAQGLRSIIVRSSRGSVRVPRGGGVFQLRKGSYA